MEIKTKYNIGDKLYMVNNFGEIVELKIKSIYADCKEKNINVYYLYCDGNPYADEVPEKIINTKIFLGSEITGYRYYVSNKKKAIKMSKELKKKYEKEIVERLEEEYQETLKKLKDIENKLNSKEVKWR